MINDMETITVTTRIDIKRERVADILYSTAQGSGYWCKFVGDLGYEKTVSELLNGGVVELEDFEDEKARYTLTLAKVKKGFEVMAEKFPKCFADFLAEDDDAGTADVLLQCALFGEVKYQ